MIDDLAERLEALEDEVRNDVRKKIIVRGWKEICQITNHNGYRSARKELKSLGLLKYDGRTPILAVDAYRFACLNRQIGKKKNGR